MGKLIRGDKMEAYMEKYLEWLSSPYLTSAEREELEEIKGNEKEIESRFYSPLKFGTAGLRGVMTLGLARMNVRVVRHATQGFANVINKHAENPLVIVNYDCRINSKSFAMETARVLVANGCRVYMFADMRPTPELSFAIRYLKADAGINITASHNPKEYNGYKAYWNDGVQLSDEIADAVAQEMENTDIFEGIKIVDEEYAIASGMLQYLGEEMDNAFLGRVKEELQKTYPKENIDNNGRLKVVYTPFHGVGATVVPQVLEWLNISDIVYVKEQMVTDGNFPTVKNPNPEFEAGFEYALKYSKECDADILIASDPDADRVAAMVRVGDDKYRMLTGNQMGVLLMDFIFARRKEMGTLPQRAAAISSLVSTDMSIPVANEYGVEMHHTFTGFRFICERQEELLEKQGIETVFAFEESIGYMCGDFLRDKDAVTMSAMIVLMALYYKMQGKTLIDVLNDLYRKHGFYIEKTVNLVMPGVDGIEKMKRLMSDLRNTPPRTICDVNVSCVSDYLTGYDSNGERLDIWGSDIMYFELEDSSSVIIRPSGTEPKIKVYILIHSDNEENGYKALEKYEDYALKLNKNY
ncbi:MAG: phospho-sugar mutase [Clostridiales bacterium]|nr:phospho-sugar mutase [Clostridiales bacterium]